MDDIFDELNSLEESEIERGRQEGYNDGLAMGLLEGRELGVQKGYELGVEAGFYSGCCETWRELKAIDQSAIPERSEKAVAALEEALAALIPILKHPRDPRILELVEGARGRFKAASAMIGWSKEYSAPVSSLSTSMEGLNPRGEAPTGLSIASLDF